jgi:dipeptidyl aminopeptidase/acylaminoacyl peptidase
MHRVGLLLLNASLLAAVAINSFGQVKASHKLTIEQLIDIKHPSNPVWSPDGKSVAFLWDRANITNLYVSSSNGYVQPLALTNYPEGGVADVFWSKDSSSVYFSHNGDLWKVPAAGGEATAVWTTTEPEVEVTPSPDGSKIAFVRARHQGEEQHGGDLVVQALSGGPQTKIAHDDESIYNLVWSPDGSQIAYIGGSKIVHHDESPDYSGEKIVYGVSEYVPGQAFVVSAGGGKATAIGTPGEYNGLAWIDGSHLTYDRQADAYKTRVIYLASTDGSEPKSVHQDKEDKFWSLPDWEAEAKPKPSPDGKWIAFLSDLDGWDHLYLMPASGGEPVKITKGKFEVWRPRWSLDGTRIAFDANEEGKPGDRRLGVATIGNDPSRASITYLVTGKGTNTIPLWSDDDKQIVYQHTDPRNSADLYVISSAGGTPVRLGDSMPKSIDRSAFVEPEFVRFPGADGQPVPGWLFVPKGLDRSKKHPAVVWIHGDGINQNYDGWHVQRNYAVYYSFHQYLLQQGYVVFAPDYRGSIGYGRDWRNGVYMDVGGNDAKDAWMAGNYLKTLPYVESQRIGVWGLSYGGFFTLIAMTDQPTLFRAGVDVAGVADYVMYYHDPYHNDWTEGRMGTPEQYPKVYANASPGSHIDQLARPLLVLHGTSDVNVPFLQSVWLMDEVLKKHKGHLVQFMIYPGEFHYFSREQILFDAWNRVDKFFAYHLRGVGDKP